SGALALAISPDRMNVYVASYSAYGVAVLKRDKVTGDLSVPSGTQACVRLTGFGGADCSEAGALFGPNSIAVSRDGKNVCVGTLSGLVIFKRDKSGALEQLSGTDGCINFGADSGDGCAQYPVTPISGPRSVTVSRDGKHVYVSVVGADAVFAFSRKADGSLSLAGCTSATGGNGVGCADGDGLRRPYAIAITRDGKNVYAACDADPLAGGDNSVVTFSRNKTTGALA